MIDLKLAANVSKEKSQHHLAKYRENNISHLDKYQR
jgi:hypothetical protein